MHTATYRVDGMTCGHCVSAVTAELSKLDDVTAVMVDLDAGEVSITSTAPLDDQAVHAAVDEAGYEMAS